MSSTLIVNPCEATLVKAGTTAGAGIYTLDLSQLRRPALVEVASIGANLMFQWWPDTDTAAITTLTDDVALAAAANITELPVAAIDRLFPSCPIEVDRGGTPYKGTIWTPSGKDKYVKNSDLRAGAGTVFSLSPVGNIALNDGDSLYWQRPVLDTYGFYVANGWTNAKRFAVPRWAKALAFLRTAGTDTVCRVTQLY